MQALLEQGEGVVGVGQHVGLSSQVGWAWLAEPREDVPKKHPEAKLGKGQAGSQVGHLLHLGIELAKRTPGRLWHAAGDGGLPLHDAMLVADP